MPDNVETTLLRIDGDADGGAKALQNTESGVESLSKSLSRAKQSFSGGAEGLEKVAKSSKEAGQEAGSGTGEEKKNRRGRNKGKVFIDNLKNTLSDIFDESDVNM